MSSISQLRVLSQIKALEKERQSKVIILGASSLETDFLPNLYEPLHKFGDIERLDVVLQSRGGMVTAARQIALLFHEFCNHLGFLVPYHCKSSSTILSLAAHEIIAGPLASFSPIDPHLESTSSSQGGSPSSLSSQDIRMFKEMSEDWFGLKSEDAKTEALSFLCGSIFPTTLTTFYRANLEAKEIGEELLSYQLADKPKAERAKIVGKLLNGYHSHSFPLTRGDMEKLGLKIKRQPLIENLAWKISREINLLLGAGVCQNLEDGWCDVIIATSDGAQFRMNKPEGPGPKWVDVQVV